MKSNLAATLVCLLLTTSAMAQSYERRTVTGRGEDRQQATLNALLEAVNQVNGVKIEAKTVTARSFKDAVEDFKERFDAVAQSKTDMTSASAGLVKSYRVLEQREAGSAVEVELDAEVLVFDPQASMLPGHRRVIAVLPFHMSRDQYAIGQQKVSAAEASASINRAIAARLVGARRFTVLDRDFLAEVSGERQIMQASNDLQQQIKLGRALGADFVLVGTVQELSGRSRRMSYGPSAATAGADLDDAAIDVSFRVVDVATGQIRVDGAVRRALRGNDARHLAGRSFQGGATDLLAYVVAAGVQEKVVEQAYPVRVLAAAGDRVVLNYGQPIINPGDVFEVFNQGGEVLVDPDTGREMGTARTSVGLVRVVESDDEKAYAQPLGGRSASDFPTGRASVCRRVEEK